MAQPCSFGDTGILDLQEIRSGLEGDIPVAVDRLCIGFHRFQFFCTAGAEQDLAGLFRPHFGYILCQYDFIAVAFGRPFHERIHAHCQHIAIPVDEGILVHGVHFRCDLFERLAGKRMEVLCCPFADIIDLPAIHSDDQIELFFQPPVTVMRQ